MNLDITRLLDHLTKKVSETENPAVLMELHHQIIETILSSNYAHKDEKIYPHIKKYIKYYIQVINEERSDYDNIEFDRVYIHFKYLDTSKQYNLSKYVERLLSQNYYVDEFIKAREKTRILKSQMLYQQLRKEFSLKKLILAAMVFSASNLKNAAYTLLLIFIAVSLATLPSPLESLKLFEFTKIKLSDNFHINHFLNVLCLILPLNVDVKLVPINIISIIIVCFFKIFSFFLIINLIFDEFTKRIKSQ